MKLMLNEKDIQKLKDVSLAKEEFVEMEKEIFVTKEVFENFQEELRKEFSTLFGQIKKPKLQFFMTKKLKPELLDKK